VEQVRHEVSNRHEASPAVVVLFHALRLTISAEDHPRWSSKAGTSSTWLSCVSKHRVLVKQSGVPGFTCKFGKAAARTDPAGGSGWISSNKEHKTKREYSQMRRRVSSSSTNSAKQGAHHRWCTQYSSNEHLLKRYPCIHN
jgi:hypothetical protein